MSIINHALKNKPVLVTGATGFIGGALAQRLAEVEGAQVTGTGRKLDAVPFLESVVELQKADLLNREEMAAAIAGKEVIFHIAAWLSTRTDQESLAKRINADATRQLIELAGEAGVKRVVLTSSIASYGPPPKIVMDEAMPVDPNQPDTYGSTKALGEIAALAAGQQHGVEVVVIRPGMVYGPRSYGWTIGMLNLINKGVPTLFGRADGHAFPVYIDNLLDMLTLAAIIPEAAGEAFNAVDTPVDWNQWFSYFSKMAGKKARRLPMPLAHVIVVANSLFNLGVPLSKERLKFYATKTIYPTTKAEQMLGYTQQIDIDEGMARSEKWLRENKYL